MRRSRVSTPLGEYRVLQHTNSCFKGKPKSLRTKMRFQRAERKKSFPLSIATTMKGNENEPMCTRRNLRISALLDSSHVLLAYPKQSCAGIGELLPDFDHGIPCCVALLQVMQNHIFVAFGKRQRGNVNFVSYVLRAELHQYASVICSVLLENNATSKTSTLV